MEFNHFLEMTKMQATTKVELAFTYQPMYPIHWNSEQRLHLNTGLQNIYHTQNMLVGELACQKGGFNTKKLFAIEISR